MWVESEVVTRVNCGMEVPHDRSRYHRRESGMRSRLWIRRQILRRNQNLLQVGEVGLGVWYHRR
jgi:hypothetical protein